MAPGPIGIPLGTQFRSSGLLADLHKLRAFGLLALLMEVGDQTNQPQQKENIGPKAYVRRQEGLGSRPCGLLHSRDQQAPDGGGHHDAGGKPGEPPLHPIPQAILKEKDAGSAQ